LKIIKQQYECALLKCVSGKKKNETLGEVFNIPKCTLEKSCTFEKAILGKQLGIIQLNYVFARRMQLIFEVQQ